MKDQPKHNCPYEKGLKIISPLYHTHERNRKVYRRVGKNVWADSQAREACCHNHQLGPWWESLLPNTCAHTGMSFEWEENLQAPGHVLVERRNWQVSTGYARIIDFKSYYSKAYSRNCPFSIGLKQVIIINRISSDKHPGSKIHLW